MLCMSTVWPWSSTLGIPPGLLPSFSGQPSTSGALLTSPGVGRGPGIPQPRTPSSLQAAWLMGRSALKVPPGCPPATPASPACASRVWSPAPLSSVSASVPSPDSSLESAVPAAQVGHYSASSCPRELQVGLFLSLGLGGGWGLRPSPHPW